MLIISPDALAARNVATCGAKKCANGPPAPLVPAWAPESIEGKMGVQPACDEEDVQGRKGLCVRQDEGHEGYGEHAT